VDSIHGVLLIEIAESAAANSRFQKCNLEENPFSLGNKPFLYCLYIQTDGTGTFRKWKAAAAYVFPKDQSRLTTQGRKKSLTAEQVSELKKRADAEGCSKVALAKEFGISRHALYMALAEGYFG
jgi:hypothetical protein